MGHSTAYGKDKLFCRQNNQLWVAALVVSSVAVVGIAIYLAFEDGKFKGWHHGSLRASKSSRGAGDVAALQPVYAAPQPVAGPAPYAPIQPTALAAPAVVVQAPLDAAPHLQASFSEVAARVRPMVVNINAIRPGRPPQPVAAGTPQFVDPFDGIPDKMINNMAFESVGSGVIVEASGYIATNAHLVDGATSVMVTRFQDPTAIPARIVAVSRDRDLALLKLDSDGPYPAARLANSDQVQVGDWVLAVGNPFGLGHTVTAGIVSSRRNSIAINGTVYQDLLQTDAPINQGSSGGPLVDLRGDVVGINTAIYAPTGVFNGTGFAIPSNQVGAFVAREMPGAGLAVAAAPPAQPYVTPVAPPPVAQPYVPPLAPQPAPQPLAAPPAPPQGWLGIDGMDVTPDIGRMLGLARPEGVFVNRVAPGSPAEDAEIRPGDVITEMAGQPIRDRASLQAVVAALPPGLKVPVVTVRRASTRTERVRLGERPTAGDQTWNPPR